MLGVFPFFARVLLALDSDFQIEAFAEKLLVFQCRNHLARFALLHVEERVVAQQVDAPQPDVLPGCVLVDEPDEIGCEKAVGLAYVDKHPLVAFLGHS